MESNFCDYIPNSMEAFGNLYKFLIPVSIFCFFLIIPIIIISKYETEKKKKMKFGGTVKNWKAVLSRSGENAIRLYYYGNIKLENPEISKEDFILEPNIEIIFLNYLRNIFNLFFFI